MKNFLACVLSVFFLIEANESFPSPYNTLDKVLPFDGTGWYVNAVPMKALLTETNAKVVIEVGSWLGASSRHIASCLPDDGILYCVDHWLGSVEHQESYKSLLPSLYEQFLSNIIHAKLTHKVIPIRLSSLEAAEVFHQMQVEPDVIYIDASHDEESVYQDLVAYYPFIKGRGLLCGDDWGWGKDFPIQKAVKRFAKEKKLRIEVHKDMYKRPWFWILRES